MVLTRVVSQDEWNAVLTNPKALLKLRVLFWRDPMIEEALKAMSHEGKICPVILACRKILDLAKQAA